jgi:putative transposase
MLDAVDISERRACRLVGLSRTSYREPPEADARTVALSACTSSSHTFVGALAIGASTIRSPARACSEPQAWRLYRENNLAVRRRRKAKRSTGAQPLQARGQPHLERTS